MKMIWVDFVERLRLATSERAVRFVIVSLRFAECCLPIPVLVLVLFIPAAVTAAYELLMGKRHTTFRQLRHMSETARLSGAQWRPCSLGKVWSARIAMCMLRFLRIWPDKLREPRWNRRCQFSGLERLEQILGEGRPVVLATLHYGNLTELYHWIRSRGIGVAFLIAESSNVPAHQNALDLLADRANGLDGVPRRIQNDPSHLWQVFKFLAQPNRVLLVAIEAHTERDIVVCDLGYSLRVALGTLRLAATTRAVVIPCLVSAEKYLRSTIHFGEPLADDIVASRNQPALGYRHILQQLGPWIAAQPEQSARVLIGSLSFLRDSHAFADETVRASTAGTPNRDGA